MELTDQGLPVYTGRRMTGNYGPAAAGAAVLACDNYFDRTIYIGNVPAGQYLSHLDSHAAEEMLIPQRRAWTNSLTWSISGLLKTSRWCPKADASSSPS